MMFEPTLAINLHKTQHGQGPTPQGRAERGTRSSRASLCSRSPTAQLGSGEVKPSALPPWTQSGVSQQQKSGSCCKPARGPGKAFSPVQVGSWRGCSFWGQEQSLLCWLKAGRLSIRNQELVPPSFSALRGRRRLKLCETSLRSRQGPGWWRMVDGCSLILPLK